MPKTKEIKYPKQITYFIATNNKKAVAHGEIRPDQVMTTGLPNVESFINKQQFQKKLQLLGASLGS
jgi:hypothetical protein